MPTVNTGVHSPDKETVPIHKIRFRFAKSEDLRLISHHDLMHVFERMLRRSGIPFHRTQGFHPKPKMSFPLSLGLGMTGQEEVFELAVPSTLSPEEALASFRDVAPPGLDIVHTRAVPSNLSSQAIRILYSVSLLDNDPEPIQTKIGTILAASELIVSRQKPTPKQMNIRPLLANLFIEKKTLKMVFWVTPGGTIKPSEILHFLELEHLLDEGAIVERTKLELADEIEESTEIPNGPIIVGSGKTAARERSTKQTPLLPGPLSFES